MKLSTTCCMRPDCSDHDCEGRQLARLLNSADGGARLHTNWSELLPADAEPADTKSHARIVVAAVLVTALVCWAAQTLGFPVSLPF